MMKVSTIGLSVLMLSTLCLNATQEEMVVIRSEHGKEFTVPQRIINAPLLFAWFREHNVEIQDMKGFTPAKDEKRFITKETNRQQAIVTKMNNIDNYLKTGAHKEAVFNYPDVGYSVAQLMQNDRLAAQPSRRKMTINNNVIKINTLGLTHQLINSIEGLEQIEGLNRFAYLDLSGNRIDALCFETLQKVHDQLYFPITLNLQGNPIRLTKQIKEQLAQLPMISILV